MSACQSGNARVGAWLCDEVARGDGDRSVDEALRESVIFITSRWRGCVRAGGERAGRRDGTSGERVGRGQRREGGTAGRGQRREGWETGLCISYARAYPLPV